MSLGVYTNTVPAALLSQSGIFTNPLEITMDGLAGGSLEERLFVRNKSTSYYYTDITVTPLDNTGISVVDGTDGYGWKLRAGNSQPTTSEWGDIDAGDPITLSGIGTAGSADTSTYLPFWLRVEIPKNADVDTFTDVSLAIEATQNNV